MKRKSAPAGLMWDEISISAPPRDPCSSQGQHNGGMTRFCGRLIILDTHMHSDTHFGTRARAADEGRSTRMPWRTHAHTHIQSWGESLKDMRAPAQTPTAARHPVSPAPLTSPQIRLYSPRLIVCDICCKAAIEAQQNRPLFAKSGSHFSVCVCACMCECACGHESIQSEKVIFSLRSSF